MGSSALRSRAVRRRLGSAAARGARGECPERDVDLLVTFGGSDPFHSTERVLALLSETPEDSNERVVVVVGPHMESRRDELTRLAGNRAELVAPGPALPSWMARSRCALTAVATTLNELAFHRVRVFLLANYPDDAPVLDYYGRNGPHVPLGVTSELEDEELACRWNEARAVASDQPARVEGLEAGARALAELLIQMPARS